MPVSIACPELSFLPQGSGVMTHRTPNAVSGAKCGCVGAVEGSDPCDTPQCPAESTLGSISKAQWGVCHGKGQSPLCHTNVGMVRGASLLGLLL